MRPLCLILGIAGGAILGTAIPTAVAASDEPTSASTSSTPTAGAVTETLVVTASLEPAKPDDLTTSVSVIDGAAMRDRQAVSVVELLATTPGVTLAQSGGPGRTASLFLRGTESNHTLVLWNGVPLNDPLFGGYDLAFLPVDGADRVEVVRGPASALYGSEALAGVIQVLTAREQDLDATLELGENAYRRIGVSGGTDLGPLHVDVAGHHRRGNGELDNDDFASDDMLVRLDGEVREGLTLGALVRGNESEVGLPWYSGAPSLRQRSDWQERELVLPLRWTSPRFALDAQAALYDVELGYRNPDDPFFTFSDSSGEMARARVVGSRQGEHLTIAGGLEWQRLEGFTASDFGVAMDHLRQRNAAVFGEARAPLGEIQLQLGLRYDDNDVYGSHLSPRLGLAWEAREDLRLRASYGEAFRAPSLGELFYPFSGNGALEPEESESAELAVDWTPGRFEVALAVFENRLTNLIDFDFIGFTNRNIGRARTRGVEAVLAWRGPTISIEANATSLEAEDRTSGLALLRRAEETANLVVRAHPPRSTVFAVLRYVGPRPDLDPVSFGRITNPSYARLDLGGRFQALSWLAPYGRVENVADREYEDVAGYPAAGRTLVGGVALSF